MRPSIDQVLKVLAMRYGLKVDLIKGNGRKDNEPRKVGMYLELCELKLKEIAAQFELWHGGLGMSRSGLKDPSGRKISQVCNQHSAKLPPKDLTFPLLTVLRDKSAVLRKP